MAEALQKVAEGRRWDNVMIEDAKTILSDESFLSNMLVATPDGQDTLLHMVAITEDPEVVKLVIEAHATRNTFKDCMTLKNKFFRTPLQAAIVHGHTDSAILLFEQCLKTCPEVISKGEDDGNTLLHNACGFPENGAILRFLIEQDICQPMILAPWSTRGYQLLPLDIAQELVMDAKSSLKTAERAKKPNRSEIQRRKQRLDEVQEMYYTIEGPTKKAQREKK